MWGSQGEFRGKMILGFFLELSFADKPNLRCLAGNLFFFFPDIHKIFS